MHKKNTPTISFASMLLSSTLMFSGVTPLHAQTQLFMAGDSTMSIKATKDYPETGWGMPFSSFFSKDLKVINLAKNGRSTKSFMSEGLWQKISSHLRKDDFVIIQFGHNDQSEHKKDRYTTPEQYQNNLSTMIQETKKAGASVLLMTPITRRHFVDANTIKKTHPYADIVRKLAIEQDLPFIDMEKLSREYFQNMGDSLSQLRFMHIKANAHPNYPKGVRDDTHLNELGAREVAQIVLAQLKENKHPLTDFLVKPDPKHLTLSY